MLRKVADLIDPIINSWDEDLLRQTLWPIDVQRVLTIPISQHDMPDFIAWNFTKRWDFFGSVCLFCGMGPPIWEQVTTYQWDGTYHGQSYLGEDLETCLSTKG